jgi:S-DNA-T family DNA segregation ATPase FtsK/SpoIIIE
MNISVEPSPLNSEMYETAVMLVTRDQKPSVSYLQRRLSVRYELAAEMMLRMQREGIVSPPDHAGRRSVLADQGTGRLGTQE